MIFREFSIVIIAIIVGIAAVVGIISGCFMGPDNTVEEVAEDLIEDQTGVRIDLSPNYEEPKMVIKSRK